MRIRDIVIIFNKLPLLTANSNGVSPILSATFTLASFRINWSAIGTLPFKNANIYESVLLRKF